jgi:hypothetical protein
MGLKLARLKLKIEKHEVKLYILNFFKKNLFYSYVHITFGSFLPPSPTSPYALPAPSLSPGTPLLPGRNYFALISNFVEERV